MTAFEILLNKFYDTIEENEPEKSQKSVGHKSNELSGIIKKFIDTSFFHGHNLQYQNVLTEMLQQSATILQQTNHEDWSKVRYAFMENDLHIIKRDRERADIANLKMKLDRLF